MTGHFTLEDPRIIKQAEEERMGRIVDKEKLPAQFKSIMDIACELLHWKEATIGLWVIDKDPKTVSYDWICENAIQLKDK